VKTAKETVSCILGLKGLERSKGTIDQREGGAAAKGSESKRYKKKGSQWIRKGATKSGGEIQQNKVDQSFGERIQKTKKTNWGCLKGETVILYRSIFKSWGYGKEKPTKSGIKV